MSNVSAKLKSLLVNRDDKEIVFTNGCFDLIHSGHIHYIKEAKSLGDVLIIGINSDDSIKKLKGSNRPINNQEDRKFVLESIKYVDFVEIFYEENPQSIIEEIKPNILVKGGDWKASSIVGADFVSSYGGLVKSLSFKTGYSTTEIIKKCAITI